MPLLLPSILMTRRWFLMAGGAAASLRAEGHKGVPFPAAWKKYSDPTTEFDVYRLTDPAYSSTLPAYYNRIIARNSAWMLFCGDRGDGPQAFRIDLKNGESRQLTQAEELDGASLTLTPDNRSFCYFAGRSLYVSRACRRCGSANCTRCPKVGSAARA